jgi:hypothetical protein
MRSQPPHITILPDSIDKYSTNQRFHDEYQSEDFIGSILPVPEETEKKLGSEQSSIKMCTLCSKV